MEFWGVEVKSGQPLNVKLDKGNVLHLSQACLGEVKKEKSNESVCLHVNIKGKKLVLGTLHSERLPQQLFDLVFDKEFQLSHNWKNGSVYFYGYKAEQSVDVDDESDESGSDEEDDIRLPVANGKQEVKKDEKPRPVKNNDAKGSAAGKQKVKIVEPGKDVKPDGADSDGSEDSDDAMSDDTDSEEENEDSSDDDDLDDEDSDEEDDETPKKQQSGKKRPSDSAIKTPGTEKKAMLATPLKTDGKKGGGHVATPHPSKQAGKSPANKSNQKSPASEGEHSCKSCNRSFKSENALQSHNQAKHK